MELGTCFENFARSASSIVATRWANPAVKSHANASANLQKSPRIKLNEASSLLQKAASDVLGSGARLNIEGSRVTLTLSGVSADSLAQFVALARTQSQAMPIEAHLQKFSAAGSPNKDRQELWRGALILSLPGG